MYKSTSRFMQGPGHRDPFRPLPPIEKKENDQVGTGDRTKTRIVATKNDLHQLGHNTANEDRFLDSIDAIIRALVREGIKNPRDQAGVLNRRRMKTAVGEQRTARLVMLFYEQMNKLRKTRGKPIIARKFNSPGGKR